MISYDGAEYKKQLIDYDDWKRSKEKYLQDFEFSFYPVLTIVLYYGYKHHWNGSRSIYDVIDIPEELKPFISDYKINVFEVA